jgi:hypothetical protein
VRFQNSITARVIVSLAALLVPAESLPMMACNCESHSSPATKAKSALVGVAAGAKCPHCTGASRPQHSCCGGTAASSSRHAGCCGGKGSCCCCCKGGSGSHGGQCQCSVNKPAPDPLPSDSRTVNTKSSISSSPNTVATVVIVPSVDLALAARQPSRSASTSLERLSTLCRLVV